MKFTVNNHDLFPTRVWCFDVSGVSDDLPILESIIKEMRHKSDPFNMRSNRVGWSSKKDLFDQGEGFKKVVALVKLASLHVLMEMGNKKPNKLGISAWANVLDPSGFNFGHNHAGAVLSGCFYVTVPDGSGDIVFKDLRPGVTLSTQGLSSSGDRHEVSFSPKPGQLIVFPSWLEHRVEVNLSKSQRISIAFNISKGSNLLPLFPGDSHK